MQGTTDTENADDTCFGFPGGLIDGSGITAAPCCCYKGFQPAVTDDANFLREVAAVIVRDVPKETSNAVTIDTKRIYMAGHSNGCMAAISMATLHSDLVAAVGCHAGTALTIFPDSYMPTPMFMVHGTADRLVPYNGSDDFLSAPSAYALIADANGCTEPRRNIQTFGNSMKVQTITQNLHLLRARTIRPSFYFQSMMLGTYHILDSLQLRKELCQLKLTPHSLHGISSNPILWLLLLNFIMKKMRMTFPLLQHV